MVAAVGFWLSGWGAGAGAPASLEPVRVCEIVQDLNAYRGKAVAVLGRYSFRANGRFLSETACESKLKTGTFEWPAALRLQADTGSAPKPPDGFDIDSAETGRKLSLVRKTTALGKFRFGSLEYDRWAIVYGRVEEAKDLQAPPADAKASKSELEPAPAYLTYRGDGVVFFLSGE